MMGGSRNGRYMCKWASVILLFLSFVYVFYLYRGVTIALQDKEDELARLNDLQGRMADQLRDLVQGHSTLQEDFKNEKVAHRQTRNEKTSLDKLCKNDLKAIQETKDEEILKLEQERDNYQNQLEETLKTNEQLQQQQNNLASRYDMDMTSCNDEKESIRRDCEGKDESIKTCMDKVLKAQVDQQTTELQYKQCSSEADRLQQKVEMKEYRVISLQSELGHCQGDLETMTTAKEEFERELQELKFQDAKTPQKRISASEKATLYNQLTAKVNRGEKLNEQELKLLDLLQNSKNDQGAREVRRNVPPTQVPLPGNEGKEQYYRGQRPGMDGQIPDNRDRRPFDDRDRNNRVPDWNERAQSEMEFGQQPIQNGMGTKFEKQQLPELAEQEEVRELQLEEQEPVVVGGNIDEMEEDDDGMAFDPADMKDEDEEEDDEINDFELAREKAPENLNLPFPVVAADNNDDNKQPMPVPNRVVDNEDEFEEEEEENNKVRSPPRFNQHADDQFNKFEQEQMEMEEEEQEQNELEDDEDNVAMVKDDIDYKDDDDLALRQFEEDMKQDREERMARLKQNGGNQDWNQGQEVNKVMEQEMDFNDLRRQGVANDMEKLQQEKVQERLNHNIGHQEQR